MPFLVALLLGLLLGQTTLHTDSLDLARQLKARVLTGGGDQAAPGHWGFMRPGVGQVPPTADQLAEITRLQSLGYVSGSTPAVFNTGTTVHLPAETWPGLRFYTSGHAPEANLIDPEGHVLHTWHFSYEQSLRDSVDHGEQFLPGDPDVTACWRRAHLFPNGNMLAIFEGHGLVCMDYNSHFLWSYPGAAHHDLDVAPDGSIHVLTREVKILPRFHTDKPVLMDFITHLSPDGHVLGSLDLLAAFENSTYASCLDNAKEAGDIFHTNTLEILDGSHADRSDIFAAGNYLISVRELGIIAIVDPVQELVIWALSGLWSAQHQPTLLANGNLLVFDNKGHAGRSKVLEFDPLTQEVVWEFADSETHGFYSQTCGSCQRLGNGNTLITESDNGRAFEVSADGRVVWEFRNPQRTGRNDEFIAAIMEMVALEADFRPTWLNQLTAAK